MALLGRLNKLITSWNDRRLRRVFLCFYLTILKPTNMFLTFAYNSKPVWSRYIEIDSGLRIISCILVPNFEAISHVILVLGPKNCHKSLIYKAVSFKNGLSTAKNFLHGYTSFDTFSSLPTTFSRNEVLLFLFCFFSLFFRTKSCTLFF